MNSRSKQGNSTAVCGVRMTSCFLELFILILGQHVEKLSTNSKSCHSSCCWVDTQAQARCKKLFTHNAHANKPSLPPLTNMTRATFCISA
eukprot:4316932-Amphidinium_carterae.1